MELKAIIGLFESRADYLRKSIVSNLKDQDVECLKETAITRNTEQLFNLDFLEQRIDDLKLLLERV